MVAVDRSAQRMKRLAENLKRLRLDEHVQSFIADSAVWRPKELVDFVLCDARAARRERCAAILMWRG